MWQIQIVPRLRILQAEVDPVSAVLKNEACVLQDEVVNGEKRECRCSTLQTDFFFRQQFFAVSSAPRKYVSTKNCHTKITRVNGGLL